jgi:HSP20 family molecular chaperone IbpA
MAKQPSSFIKTITDAITGGQREHEYQDPFAPEEEVEVQTHTGFSYNPSQHQQLDTSFEPAPSAAFPGGIHHLQVRNGDPRTPQQPHIHIDAQHSAWKGRSQPARPAHSDDGVLAVDMFETDSAIVIRAIVAGMSPTNLDISITRDQVIIKGSREMEQDIPADQFVLQELYWGPFSRTIQLPDEIDLDQADALDRYGILILTLPKINKAREARVRVRTK